jgi:ATP-dependent Clp protease, protease subunit
MSSQELVYAQMATGESVRMYLYAGIGGERGISGQQFANELQWLVSNGYKKITVHINSPGGGILEGWSILSAILTINREKNGVTIDTCNDGLAASIASAILLAGKKIMMLDWAKVMVHNPSYGKADDQMSESEKKTLAEFKDSILTLFANRTKKTAEEISEMMHQTTWLNAEQAFAGGFIDEIIPTTKVKKSEAMNVLCEASNELQDANFAFALYKAIIEESNKNLLINPNTMEGTKEFDLTRIKNSLGLVEAEVKEAQILEKISQLRAEAIAGKALQNELDFLRVENTRLQAQVQETKKVQCENLVEEAIKANKLRSSQKQEWLDIAMMSFETAKKAIDAMNGHPQLSQMIQRNGDERADWTWEKWANNDAQGLLEMKKNNPEAYAELYKSYYGFTPTIENK